MRLILLLTSMLLIGSADAQRKQSDSLRMDGYEHDHVGLPGSDNVGYVEEPSQYDKRIDSLKEAVREAAHDLGVLYKAYKQVLKRQAATDSILDKITQGNLHLIQGCIDEKRRLDHLIEFLQQTAAWKKSL